MKEKNPQSVLLLFVAAVVVENKKKVPDEESLPHSVHWVQGVFGTIGLAAKNSSTIPI